MGCFTSKPQNKPLRVQQNQANAPVGQQLGPREPVKQSKVSLNTNAAYQNVENGSNYPKSTLQAKNPPNGQGVTKHSDPFAHKNPSSAIPSAVVEDLPIHNSENKNRSGIYQTGLRQSAGHQSYLGNEGSKVIRKTNESPIKVELKKIENHEVAESGVKIQKLSEVVNDENAGSFSVGLRNIHFQVEID